MQSIGKSLRGFGNYAYRTADGLKRSTKTVLDGAGQISQGVSQIGLGINNITQGGWQTIDGIKQFGSGVIKTAGGATNVGLGSVSTAAQAAVPLMLLGLTAKVGSSLYKFGKGVKKRFWNSKQKQDVRLAKQFLINTATQIQHQLPIIQQQQQRMKQYNTGSLVDKRHNINRQNKLKTLTETQVPVRQPGIFVDAPKHNVTPKDLKVIQHKHNLSNDNGN